MVASSTTRAWLFFIVGLWLHAVLSWDGSRAPDVRLESFVGDPRYVVEINNVEPYIMAEVWARDARDTWPAISVEIDTDDSRMTVISLFDDQYQPQLSELDLGNVFKNLWEAAGQDITDLRAITWHGIRAKQRYDAAQAHYEAMRTDIQHIRRRLDNRIRKRFVLRLPPQENLAWQLARDDVEGSSFYAIGQSLARAAGRQIRTIKIVFTPPSPPRDGDWDDLTIHFGRRHEAPPAEDPGALVHRVHGDA